MDERRREFATARRCAREALAVLGHPPAPILRGERGAPIGPNGVVGSITHCDGYRAAVVARETDLWTVGVDAEPNEPLPDGVLASIADPDGQRAIARLLSDGTGVRWDRLLFCAKEAELKGFSGRWTVGRGLLLAALGKMSTATPPPSTASSTPPNRSSRARAGHARWIADLAADTASVRRRVTSRTRGETSHATRDGHCQRPGAGQGIPTAPPVR